MLQKLTESRRFWVLIIDTFVSIAGFIVAHYVPDPNTADLVKFLVITLQPICLTIVAAYTVDDVQAFKAGVHPWQVKADGAPKAQG